WQLFNHTEKQPQPSGSIPFDGESLNFTAHWTMFDELIGTSTDLNTVAFQQFPSRLLERERFALAHFLVLRRTFGEPCEKALIGAIQAFQYILDSLRTKLLPKGIAVRSHSQVRNMRLEYTEWDVLPAEAVVTLLQRQRVIPDCTRNVNLAMQMLVAF